MPILFAYTLLIDGTLIQQLEVFLFGLLGLYTFTSVFTGYLFRSLRVVERTLLVGVALLLFWPSLYAHIAGAMLLAGFYVYQTRFRGAQAPAHSSAS